MPCSNEKVGCPSEVIEIKLEEQASLKNVPLEVRREEAKKPLFLARYE